MTEYLTLLVGLLLLILLAGMVRILIGPTTTDRMLAAQLFGTVGVAVLILLSFVQTQGALLNVALVLALLAPLTLIAFIRLQGNRP